MTEARRIIVTGPVGAGKTTFAAALSKELGLPHIELDPLYIRIQGWLPENRESLRETLQARFDASPSGWILDGGQRQALEIVVEQADLLIWLHFRAHVAFPRLVRRSVVRRKRKELLWGMMEQRWRDLFSRHSPILWGAALWRAHHRETRAFIRNRRPEMRVVVLRSPKAAACYLADASNPAPVR